MQKVQAKNYSLEQTKLSSPQICSLKDYIESTEQAGGILVKNENKLMEIDINCSIHGNNIFFEEEEEQNESIPNYLASNEKISNQELNQQRKLNSLYSNFDLFSINNFEPEPFFQKEKSSGLKIEDPFLSKRIETEETEETQSESIASRQNLNKAHQISEEKISKEIIRSDLQPKIVKKKILKKRKPKKLYLKKTKEGKIELLTKKKSKKNLIIQNSPNDFFKNPYRTISNKRGYNRKPKHFSSKAELSTLEIKSAKQMDLKNMTRISGGVNEMLKYHLFGFEKQMEKIRIRSMKLGLLNKKSAKKFTFN